MFEQLFSRPGMIGRYASAPLVDCRVRYLAHCAASGAKLSTLRKIANHQIEAVRLLKLRDGDRVDLSRIEAAAGEWSLPRPVRHGGPASPGGEAVFAAHTVRWLRFLGWLDLPERERHPNAARVAAFADWMRRERGLSEHTIRARCWAADEFLGWLDDAGLSLETLRVADMDRVAAEKNARGDCVRATIHAYAKRVRAFLRFAEQRDWCAPGMARAVMPPRVHVDETVPAGLAWEDVQRLLATTAGDRPGDKRDRAVLLLFAVYGLRSGEVGGLRLDDIDWDAETLRVRRPKPGRVHLYPLSRSVGQAIVRYVREVRPRRSGRTLFFTLVAPIRPLGASALWGIVSKRLRRLGIVSRHRGPHLLRHACAQHLLDRGLSMKEIGDHLGHRSPTATAVYAKVDLAGLREVADFDLEGLA